MEAVPFPHPRKVILLWLCLLITLCIAVAASNVFLFRYANRLRASDYRTYVAEAQRCIVRNDFPSAKSQLDEALRLNPNASEIHLTLGELYYRLKNWEQAIAAYRRAVELGSTEPGLKVSTVWCLIELKRFDEAASFGEQAIAEGAVSPALSRYVAEAHFRAANFADAIPHYQAALKAYPNDLYLMDHLRQAFERTGNPEQAAQVRGRIAEVEAVINTLGIGAP